MLVCLEIIVMMNRILFHISCRSGSYNDTGCVNKLDRISLPTSSNARSISKSESDKVCLSRDQTAGISKERLVAKGNNKYVVFLSVCVLAF